MWEVTKTSVVSENGQTHDTFGVSNGSTTINDVSLDEQKILDLVKLMNMLDISEAHACDIVEDFLGV